MARVLIVDDEQEFCEDLEFFLTRQGHQVRSASGGQAAIELICHERPEVLVTDWMLRDHVHGLHLCEAVRAVTPDTQAILISGYPSRDLRTAADDCEVFEFIEKPFEPSKLDRLIRRAQAGAREAGQRRGIPVIELSAHGDILYANPEARRQWPNLLQGDHLGSWAQFHRWAHVPDWRVAGDRWLEMSARGDALRSWTFRSRRLASSGNWLVVFRPQQMASAEHLPILNILLGIHSGERAPGPFQGRIAIVASDPAVRQVLATTLRWQEYPCHTLEDPGQLMELLCRDSRVGGVLINARLRGDELGTLVTQARTLRPGLRFITLSEVSPGQLAALSQALVLESRSVSGVVPMLLSGQLGRCLDCGRPVAFYESAQHTADAGSYCQCG